MRSSTGPNGGTITISAHKDDKGVLIAIKDQGMGIPKDHLPKVCSGLHRVDNRDTREVGGTGIGLYLVKHLVEAHHGTIWVDSEVGEGTTSRIHPAAQAPSSEEDAA